MSSPWDAGALVSSFIDASLLVTGSGWPGARLQALVYRLAWARQEPPGTDALCKCAWEVGLDSERTGGR